MAFLKIILQSLIFPSSYSTLAADSQISGFLGLVASADLSSILAFLTSPKNYESNFLELS